MGWNSLSETQQKQARQIARDVLWEYQDKELAEEVRDHMKESAKAEIRIEVTLNDDVRTVVTHRADEADMSSGGLRLYRDGDVVAAYVPSAWHSFRRA